MITHTHLTYHGITDISTDIVKVDIDSSWAELTQPLLHILLLIVHSSIKPNFRHQNRAFVICPTDTDHSGTALQEGNLRKHHSLKKKCYAIAYSMLTQLKVRP